VKAFCGSKGLLAVAIAVGAAQGTEFLGPPSLEVCPPWDEFSQVITEDALRELILVDHLMEGRAHSSIFAVVLEHPVAAKWRVDGTDTSPTDLLPYEVGHFVQVWVEPEPESDPIVHLLTREGRERLEAAMTGICLDVRMKRDPTREADRREQGPRIYVWGNVVISTEEWLALDRTSAGRFIRGQVQSGTTYAEAAIRRVVGAYPRGWFTVQVMAVPRDLRPIILDP
jgi:hypothetical protein